MPPRKLPIKKKKYLEEVTDDATLYLADHYGKQVSAALSASLINLIVSWRNEGYRDAILAPADALAAYNKELAVIRAFSLDLFGAFLTWYLIVSIGGYLLRLPIKAAASAWIGIQGPPPRNASSFHRLTWYFCDQKRFRQLPPAAPGEADPTIDLEEVEGSDPQHRGECRISMV